MYQIKQGETSPRKWSMPNRKLALVPSKVTVPRLSERARVGLIAPVPIPQIKFQDEDGEESPVLVSGKPRLVNLWATWCAPCMLELGEWKERQKEIAASGIEIVMINVDEPKTAADERAEQVREIKAKVTEMGLPFTLGFGDQGLVSQFDVLQRSILRRQRSLPVPTSFLVDGRGHLRVIYKGPVEADQLIADAKLLEAPIEDVVAASVPYPGKWLGQPAGSAPNQIAIRFIEGGFSREAEQYIRQLTKMEVDNPLYNRAEANVLLGALLLDQKRLEEAATAFSDALKQDPNHRQSHIELAGIQVQTGQFAEAAGHFEAALERRQNDPELRIKLGQARMKNGQLDLAIREFRAAAELRPNPAAHHNCGNALLATGDVTKAIDEFEKALEVNPRFTPSANNLAWLLSTSPDASLRDGKRAVELAKAICSQASARSPSNLDTLAVAHAEAGDFEQAIAAAKEAVRIAKAAGDLRTSSEIQKRLTLFHQKKPYHGG